MPEAVHVRLLERCDGDPGVADRRLPQLLDIPRVRLDARFAVIGVRDGVVGHCRVLEHELTIRGDGQR